MLLGANETVQHRSLFGGGGEQVLTVTVVGGRHMDRGRQRHPNFFKDTITHCEDETFVFHAAAVFPIVDRPRVYLEGVRNIGGLVREECIRSKG